MRRFRTIEVNMTLLKDFNSELYNGINLTGYHNEELHNLGFETYDFIIDKSKGIEDQVIHFFKENLQNFKRIFLVPPHFRASIPYVIIAIKEITGNYPIIVYFKLNSQGEYEPRATDLNRYRDKCRTLRAHIRKKLIDKN